MKACIYRNYGPTNVLAIEEIDQPVPRPDEILVKVIASSVNRTDCAMLRGQPWIMRAFLGWFKPKNPILGTEFSGVILGKGSQVNNFDINDRVFGFNDLGLSAYAEFLVIKEGAAIAKIPQSIDFSQAATSMEGAHYAVNYINKLNIHAGERILINGASGAIGSALLQFCVALGAKVVAVSEHRHTDLLLELGADRVIDYTQQDFTQEAEQYDYVFDTVGKSSFFRCRHVLKKHGVYISSEPGAYAQNIYLPLLSKIMGSRRVIFPFPCPPIHSLPLIKQFIEEGSFMPVMDKTFSLEEIASAFDYVLNGQKRGNVVLNIENH